MIIILSDIIKQFTGLFTGINRTVLPWKKKICKNNFLNERISICCIWYFVYVFIYLFIYLFILYSFLFITPAVASLVSCRTCYREVAGLNPPPAEQDRFPAISQPEPKSRTVYNN